MLLKDVMDGASIASTWEGIATNDDWVLAVCVYFKDRSNLLKYAVVQGGIEGVDSSFNANTVDKTYIRSGQSTIKTGTQRSFSITGDRFIGDEFQDYVFSHGIKYGTGESVITDYVYFNMRNGQGEKGQVSVIVNSDAGGNAGDNSTISVELRKTKDKPEEFSWFDVDHTTGEINKPEGSSLLEE